MQVELSQASKKGFAWTNATVSLFERMLTHVYAQEDLGKNIVAA